MKYPVTVWRLALVSLLLVLLSGCATSDRHRHGPAEPERRLAELVAEYRHARDYQTDCYQSWRGNRGSIDCERVVREIQRLSIEYPANVDIQLASAIVNYEAGHTEQAQVQLDMLLGARQVSAEGARLRARIALEAGNQRLARRLVDRALRQHPQDPGLHELSAAIYYLDGEHDAAVRELELAARKGSYAWRVAYHRGLLSEAKLDWTAACNFYESVLLQKPDYRGAQARLFALEAQGNCGTSARTTAAGRNRISP